MSDPSRAVLRPNVGTTPEQARDARARAWAFIFVCHAKRKAAGLAPIAAAKVKHEEEVSDVNQHNQ